MLMGGGCVPPSLRARPHGDTMMWSRVRFPNTGGEAAVSQVSATFLQ
jgi:hypothetical protein